MSSESLCGDSYVVQNESSQSPRLTTRQLPAHADGPPIIPFNQLQQKSQFAVAFGGFSDIYLGHWQNTKVHKILAHFYFLFLRLSWFLQVAIKILRTFSSQNNEKIARVKIVLFIILTIVAINHCHPLQRLNREIAIWKRLQHPNIAIFYGVSYWQKNRAGIVSEWYENGTVPLYIESQKGRVNIHNMVHKTTTLLYLSRAECQVGNGHCPRTSLPP